MRSNSERGAGWLFISAAWFVACTALSMVLWLGALIPGVRTVLAGASMLVFPIISLGALALTVMLMLKAWQGSILTLPFLTDMATRYAASRA